MVTTLVKLIFTSQPSHLNDSRDAITFCEKIKRRFPVTARAELSTGELEFIIVSFLSDNDEKAGKLANSILEFCDGSDFGRIFQSFIVSESIEDIEELNGEDDMEYDR